MHLKNIRNYIIFILQIGYIKWDDIIPLKSVLEGYHIKSSNLLNEMYWCTNLPKKNPKLPEGINELGILFSPFHRNYVDWYMEYFDYYKNATTIVLPNSLRVFKLYGDYHKFLRISELPYGIKEIDISDSYIPPIPPTVEKIKIRYTSYYYIHANYIPEIIFFDFKNSSFLRNKDNIIGLLRGLISSKNKFCIKFLTYEDNNERIIIYDKELFSYTMSGVYYKEYKDPRYDLYALHWNNDVALNKIADKILSELSIESNRDTHKSQSLYKKNQENN